jgi:hypothetical protein
MSEKVITLNEPHENQQKVISEAKRFNVLCCGRRWGKSALAVNLLSETSIASYPVGYFTPTYKLLDGTYTECIAALEPIIKRKHEHQFIELVTGGRIEFWSLENELAGRSRKYKRVIVDEAAFVKKLWKSWTESIRPTLTDLKGDGWMLSTPRGKNDFFKLYMKGKQQDENWQAWQMSTYTNPYIDPSEVNDAKADLPELAFSQEYLAEFNDNVANPFGYPYIQQCTFPLSNLPAVCFGIDLAKSFDYTVIIGLDRNGSVCHFERFQSDWRTTTRKILDLPNVPIAIDSTGVGDPIGEDIARLRDVELFQFTSRSKQQIMEGLAVAIQKRKITFPEGPIKDELELFEFEYTRSGVRYTAPQGLHDDCVCSLALALHKWRPAQHYGQYSII